MGLVDTLAPTILALGFTIIVFIALMAFIVLSLIPKYRLLISKRKAYTLSNKNAKEIIQKASYLANEILVGSSTNTVVIPSPLMKYVIDIHDQAKELNA